MKRVLFALVCIGSTAYADVNVLDNDETITVDCAKDKTVNIVGNTAKIVLTGVCDMVQISGNEAKVSGSVKAARVSGNDNKLLLEAVDSIMVSGNDNTITYKKPIAKKKTGVLNSGNHNKIAKAR